MKMQGAHGLIVGSGNHHDVANLVASSGGRPCVTQLPDCSTLVEIHDRQVLFGSRIGVLVVVRWDCALDEELFYQLARQRGWLVRKSSTAQFVDRREDDALSDPCPRL